MTTAYWTVATILFVLWLAMLIPTRPNGTVDVGKVAEIIGVFLAIVLWPVTAAGLALFAGGMWIYSRVMK